jgi:hypothetical protein
VSSPISYRLDAGDGITEISGPWDEFARANGAPELTRERVLRRRLFDFFADPTTSEIYRQLFARVRRTGEPARVPFRCDGADRVRAMELAIRPLPDDGLELESRSIDEAARPLLPLFAPRSPASDELLTVCSWCKDGLRTDGSWTDLATLAAELGLMTRTSLPGLTHGICPRCEREWRAELGELP